MFENAIRLDSKIHAKEVLSGVSIYTRSDYEKYCLETDLVSSKEDIWRNEILVKQIQRHWHTMGQNGCMFAQAAIRKSEKYGWFHNVYRQSIDEVDDTTIQKIDEDISAAIADKNNQALSLLFPLVVSGNDAVSLINRLTTSKNILLASSGEESDVTTYQLRTPLKGNIQSWIVGFGPMEFLPITRKAPVLELAIRTKEKPENLPALLNSDPKTAHLADIPMSMAFNVIERIWSASVNRTADLLGGIEERRNNKFASAKVTFAIPTNIIDHTNV